LIGFYAQLHADTDDEKIQIQKENFLEPDADVA